MKLSVKGYKKNSPDKDEDMLVIPSNRITTKDMAFPIIANGRMLFPDTGDYMFNENMVVEKPVLQEGEEFFPEKIGETIIPLEPIGERKTNFFDKPELGKNRFTEYLQGEKKQNLYKNIPLLSSLNLVRNRFSEIMKNKELEEEYRRMQILQNIPSSNTPEGYQKYGNPYVYQGGGDIEGMGLNKNMIRFGTKISGNYTNKEDRVKTLPDKTLNDRRRSKNFMEVEDMKNPSYHINESTGKLEESPYRKRKQEGEKVMDRNKDFIEAVYDMTTVMGGAGILKKGISSLGKKAMASNISTIRGPIKPPYKGDVIDVGMGYTPPTIDPRFMAVLKEIKEMTPEEKIWASWFKGTVPPMPPNKQLGGILGENFAGKAYTDSDVSYVETPLINELRTEKQFTYNIPMTEGGTDYDNFRSKIIDLESSGDYQALPKDKKTGKIVSSAVGAYQFLWNKHKPDIKRVTGVQSKEQFKNNPEAQDKYFKYWHDNILLPTAMTIKSFLKYKSPSLDELKAKVHFMGAQGAKDYYFKGKTTRDAFNTTSATYGKGKFKEGGEYEMTEDEVAQILKNGGEIEYIT